MAGLARIMKAIKAAKKVKKHGVKAGQKSLVKPSQKKSVKNGRHQEKETPKASKISTTPKKVTTAVTHIPVGLDGAIILDEDLDVGGYEEPHFDENDDFVEEEPDADEDK